MDSNSIIKIGKQLKQVLGYIDSFSQYQEDKVYIDRNTNWCYIYTNNKTSVYNGLPTMRLVNGKIVLNENVTSKEMDERYSIKNVHKEVLPSDIIKNTDPKTELYDDETISSMNTSASKFRPQINEDDDAIKKCIKASILISGVDVNRYKYKLPTNYAFTNMKSLLVSKTKVGIKNFELWTDYLDFGFKIIIYDRRPEKHKLLKEDIVYDSEKGLFNNVPKGDLEEYD